MLFVHLVVLMCKLSLNVLVYFGNVGIIAEQSLLLIGLFITLN